VVNAAEQRWRTSRVSDPGCGTLNWRVIDRPILNLILQCVWKAVQWIVNLA